jgi:hypothetical protein
MSQELPYLTDDQRESLGDLPFSVLLPKGLPEGWSVATWDFDQLEEGASFSLGLTKGTAKLHFMTTNEGIGDPPGGDRTSHHAHSDLGEVKVEHEEDGDFLSDWLEVENGWSAVGGNGLSDSEIDLVIEQLAAF